MKLQIRFSVLVSAMALSCASFALPDVAEHTQHSSALSMALNGLGGKTAVDQLSNFEIEAVAPMSTNGYEQGRTGKLQYYMRDEGVLPGSTRQISESDYTVKVDFSTNSMQLDYFRVFQYPYVNAIAPGAPNDLYVLDKDYREIIVSDVGYSHGDNENIGLSACEWFFGAQSDQHFQPPTGKLTSERLGSIRMNQALLNPQILLRQINVENTDELRRKRWHGQLYRRLKLDLGNVPPVVLWINKDTSKIDRLTTKTNNHFRRDQKLEVRYDDWSWGSVDGVRFPRIVSTYQNGVLTRHEERTAVHTVNMNELPISLPAPCGITNPLPFNQVEFDLGRASSQFNQSFGSLGFQMLALVPLQSQDLQPLDTGIYRIEGFHNSMVIDQGSSLVVLEAPTSPQRADDILAFLAGQFPGKPISHVVVTHHHQDHAGGIRSYIAAGIKVVASKLTKRTLKKVARAKSKIIEDSQATVKKPLIFEAVKQGQLKVIGGATNKITLAHVPNTHAADMIVAKIEGANGNFVFESDLYNPSADDPFAASSDCPLNAASFLGTLQAPEASGGLGLTDPATVIVSGHIGIGPMAILGAYVGISSQHPEMFNTCPEVN